MHRVFWSAVAAAIIAVGCSAEPEPEVITQRLAAPEPADPAAAGTDEVTTTTQAPTTIARPSDPACATLFDAVTGKAVVASRGADGPELIDLLRAAYADFDQPQIEQIDSFVAALAVGDPTTAATVFGELDAAVNARCGFPGGVTVLVPDLVPPLPFCQVSSAIGEEPTAEEQAAFEECSSVTEQVPNELPCFAVGPDDWLTGLTDPEGRPWLAVSCATGDPVEWSHAEGSWIDAA